MAKEKGLGLLKNLAFYPEYREDGGKTEPVEIGRFKHFAAVSKQRSSSILIANLLFIVTLLPLIAVFVLVVAFGGVEAIAYKLKGITDAPYLMSTIGFGISNAGLSQLDVKMYMLEVYYLIFAGAGVGTFFMSIGLAGMVPLCMKFIIGDSFDYKKDNYGNHVPKAINEFFKGIKRCWWQMLIVGVIFLALFAGIGNVFVYFVGAFWAGTAGAGHWIMVILAGIVALFTFMFLLHLIPSIALYDMPFGLKMKNSAIFMLQFFLQNLLIVLVFAVPVVLATVMSSLVSAVIIAILLVFGSKYYCLVMCNYEQYISEKIIQPIYQAKYVKPTKQKNTKKKKK